jgi:hypothetical protein
MEDSLYGYDDSEVDAEFEEEHKMTKADAKWLIEFCGKHI